MAAITDNTDVPLVYDLNQVLQSSRILPNIAPDTDEFACQCVCVEMLRGLLATGVTVDAYNNMDELTWDSWMSNLREEAIFRASLNVVSPVMILDSNAKLVACNQGASWFEHGYVYSMDRLQQGDKVQFTKLGGMQ